MAHVLVMATRQLRYPVVFPVFVIAADGLFHAEASLFDRPTQADHEYIANATQIITKLTSLAVLSGSWKIYSAIRNWIVGLMYIRKPTVDSFKRRAAPAKASSGMAVTAPLEASNNAL